MSPDEPESPVPAAEVARDRARLVRAMDLAWDWHGSQTRKGRPTSYVSHLVQVQGLVLDAGGSADEAIAALLHDGLEDAETPEERADREAILASDFGPAVLRIGLDCTDTTPDEAGASKGAWRPRKERYLEQLRRAGPASRLVAACDKRQNLGDLVSDLRLEGGATLERFNAGAAEQLWYFRSLDAVCRPDLPPKLARELTHLVTELEGLLDA